MKKIIVITDCAFGLPFHDPDDGLALHHLLNNRTIQVRAIVTTFGNTSESKVYLNVKSILKKENKDILIIRGQKQNTTSKIYNLVKNYPNKISILNLGPLTVLDKCLKDEPSIPKYWKELVIMGGLGKIKHPLYPFIKEEFNVRKDPSAFSNVTTNTKHILVTKEDCLKDLFTLSDIFKLPTWMRPQIFLWYLLNLLIAENGFNPNDLTAAKVISDS